MYVQLLEKLHFTHFTSMVWEFAPKRASKKAHNIAEEKRCISMWWLFTVSARDAMDLLFGLLALTHHCSCIDILSVISRYWPYSQENKSQSFWRMKWPCREEHVQWWYCIGVLTTSPTGGCPLSTSSTSPPWFWAPRQTFCHQIFIGATQHKDLKPMSYRILSENRIFQTSKTFQ